MVLLEKIKESAISVIPVMLVVCLLHLTAAPLGDALAEFLVGGVLLILGLSVFLLGADIGVVPVGQKAGSALTSAARPSPRRSSSAMNRLIAAYGANLPPWSIHSNHHSIGPPAWPLTNAVQTPTA